MKRTLYIDFPNLSIRNFLAPIPSQKFGNLDPDFHKHQVLTSIFYNIKKFKPDEVVLALDDLKNWRKKVYPLYKANRKKSREADDIDWEAYFEHINEFVEELKIFPFKIIKVPYCEADDIIGVLTSHTHDSNNVIITSDRDYIQLLKFKNNILYDPIKKKIINEKDPERALKLKIIMGDSGDNIPAIKPRVGEKTAIKILDTGLLKELLKEEDIKKQFNINRMIISFNHIPDKLKKTILNTHLNYSFEPNKISYYEWAVKHNLPKFSSLVSGYETLLNRLKCNSKPLNLEEIF